MSKTAILWLRAFVPESFCEMSLTIVDLMAPPTFQADCCSTTFSFNYFSDRIRNPTMASECVCIGWRIGEKPGFAAFLHDFESSPISLGSGEPEPKPG